MRPNKNDVHWYSAGGGCCKDVVLKKWRKRVLVVNEKDKGRRLEEKVQVRESLQV